LFATAEAPNAPETLKLNDEFDYCLDLEFSKHPFGSQFPCAVLVVEGQIELYASHVCMGVFFKTRGVGAGIWRWRGRQCA
jgi:hypothetical protein